MQALYSERLMLRLICEEDTQAIFKLFSDERVLKYYDLAPFQSLDQVEQFISRMISRWENKQGFRYAIWLNDGQCTIGTCGVNRIIEMEDGVGAVIGYDLLPTYWGQGYMFEALSYMITAIQEQPFLNADLNQLVAEVFPDNHRSIHLLERLGFHLQIEHRVISGNLDVYVRPLKP